MPDRDRNPEPEAQSRKLRIMIVFILLALGSIDKAVAFTGGPPPSPEYGQVHQAGTQSSGQLRPLDIAPVTTAEHASPPRLEVLKTIRGTVVRVVDGDTITVLDERLPLRIRLYGIDAPEKRQPHHQKAKEYVSEWCFGKTVILEILDVDQYGRFVAEVFLEEDDRALLNHLVLAAGYAWHYKEYSSDEEYDGLERLARESGFGLWADSGPVPPWIFRSLMKRRR